MANQDYSTRHTSSQPVIHRGQFVVAGVAPGSNGQSLELLEDGAVAVSGGLVQAVGYYRDIHNEFGYYPVQDHEGKILTPALINAHCHLELSYIDSIKQKQFKKYSGDQTEWIRDLLKAREIFIQENPESEAIVLDNARRTLQSMADGGVSFVGDIGNSLQSRHIGDDQDSRVCFLLELLGLSRESETKAFARLAEVAADKSCQIDCTPHAPYSTTPALIQAIKKQADKNGRIISIHVAESSHEVEFLQFGRGPFKEFLAERGVWDESFAIPGMRSVHYLDDLGVLDKNTLCVHAVHVNMAEIELLAKRNASVCLCPGSNRFLDMGKAPVTEFLAHGILPALGTDSLASNEILNIWREMRLLREDHPGLAPESVFAMATMGGAAAWGVDAELGLLAAGRKPLILAVNCPDKMYSSRQVFEYLTTVDESVEIEWLSN